MDGSLLFKFRKKVIPDDKSQLAIRYLKNWSKKKNDNRGAVAGIINEKKLPNYVQKIINPNSCRSLYYKKNGTISSRMIGNLSSSNVAGFLDKKDKSCRTTKFTRDHPELWGKIQPLLILKDEIFSELVPERYHNQKKMAEKTKFHIPNTCFSTITVNYNWRTACHKDSGDLKEGFSNIIICEEGNFDGYYIGFPQYKICINVKQGDFFIDGFS
jgi:hypothetical protein